MDSDKLDAERTKSVEKNLSLVRSIVDKDQLTLLIVNLQRLGVNAYWMFDVESSSMNILHLCHGGIGMGERDYYFNNDASTKNIRNILKQKYSSFDWISYFKTLNIYHPKNLNIMRPEALEATLEIINKESSLEQNFTCSGVL